MPQTQLEKEKQSGDEYVAALTFFKNDASGKEEEIPKGSAFALASSSQYKLAVASAKTRFEIEWLSSNWCSREEDEKMMKERESKALTEDDRKDERL